MTESELQNLLTRAAWRMRSVLALSAALRALGVALIAAALAVAWMRLSGHEAIGIFALAVFPFVVTVLVGAVVFLSSRSDSIRAAAILDQRAGTSEQLVTWRYLHGLNDAELSETQRGFRAAQRDAALLAAGAIQLKTHMPIAWPAWSRALWLAVIMLLSAILMPPNQPEPPPFPERSPGIGVSANPNGNGNGKDASAMLRDVPRVQVLAPAQMRKLELIATDPQLPESMKRDALKELNDAIAGVSENELTPDVRQLLDLLRKETGASNPATKADGSFQVSSKEEAAKTTAANAKVAEYAAFENVEQAWAESESEFADVRERLARYYEKK